MFEHVHRHADGETGPASTCNEDDLVIRDGVRDIFRKNLQPKLLVSCQGWQSHIRVDLA